MMSVFELTDSFDHTDGIKQVSIGKGQKYYVLKDKMPVFCKLEYIDSYQD